MKFLYYVIHTVEVIVVLIYASASAWHIHTCDQKRSLLSLWPISEVQQDTCKTDLHRPVTRVRSDTYPVFTGEDFTGELTTQ